jgi:uncharacterized protein YceK
VRFKLRLSLAALSVAAAVTSSGCSTVVLSQDPQQQETAAEHAALAEAASAVAAAPWPKTAPASWSERLAGADQPELRISTTDAAQHYVASLGVARRDAVLAEAARHLSAARALVEVAEAMSGALRPVMADVSLVEGAISDLRQARDIYLASLKLIDRAGEPVAAAEARRLKSDFGAVIGALGAAADRLAEEVESDPRRTFAGPAPRFVN